MLMAFAAGAVGTTTNIFAVDVVVVLGNGSRNLSLSKRRWWQRPGRNLAPPSSFLYEKYA